MPAIICPKCGHNQLEGPECLRCGVIFERCRSSISPKIPNRPAIGIQHPKTKDSLFRTVYRTFRWVSLGVLLMVLVLILRKTDPPIVPTSPEAAQRAAVKVEELQNYSTPGSLHTIELEEEELNGWLAANLALKAPASGDSRQLISDSDARMAIARRTMSSGTIPTMTAEEVRSSLTDLRVDLKEDRLRAYASFEANGVSLSLEMEGYLAVQGGYLRLIPLEGKLGSLPLKGAVLTAALKRIFEPPENKEKFRLPPHIRDLRVQNERLIIELQ